MATRTTETAVREIIETGLTGPQVRAFIADANVWVTEELAGETPTPSATRLEIIERYLACALIRLRDVGLKDSTIEDVKESYQVDPDVTDYLLRAASFDASGKVRAHFLTPPDATGESAVPKQVVFRVGEGYADDACES